MSFRIFRNKVSRQAFIRELFVRVSPDKTLFFTGENRAEKWDTFSYDGKVLTMFDKDPFVELHEVCHHLLASPERREEVNWGCGGGPFQSKLPQPLGARLPNLRPTFRDCVDEEVDTCMLHMALAKFLGCGERARRADMRSINFDALPILADIEDLETRYPNALPKWVWRDLKACHT